MNTISPAITSQLVAARQANVRDAVERQRLLRRVRPQHGDAGSASSPSAPRPRVRVRLARLVPLFR